MNAAEELRGTLSNTVCHVSNYTKRAQPYLLGSDMSAVLDKTADALLAAGYRKPRTISSIEELDALPEGAVIRDNDGDVFEAVRCTGDVEAGVPDYNCWDQVAETWPLDSDKIALPASVLDEADQ